MIWNLPKGEESYFQVNCTDPTEPGATDSRPPQTWSASQCLSWELQLTRLACGQSFFLWHSCVQTLGKEPAANYPVCRLIMIEVEVLERFCLPAPHGGWVAGEQLGNGWQSQEDEPSYRGGLQFPNLSPQWRPGSLLPAFSWGLPRA